MSSAIPENRASFSLQEIAAATGGALSGSGAERVTGVVTDTRSPLAGKLFVALAGERYDGHVFASAALRGGARALLVEREIGEAGLPVVRVGSTLAALGALARYHRRRWAGRVLAVAGSAGKTTTKSALSAALDAVAPGGVHFAPGNLNNAIGVPMVLFGLEPEHRYGVVEIGTNAPGEVAALAGLAEPELGVVTVIGLEHTAGLGSLDRIEAEEGSLYQALPESGIAIGNADDERVARQLAGARAATKRSYGFGESADYRVLDRALGGLGPSRVRLGRPDGAALDVDCPLLGRAGAYALAAALAAAEACSGRALEPGALEAAFARVGVGEPGRLAPIRLGNGAIVLDDTYNSNPASLKSSIAAALETARARGARLILVLGEMRELGDDSPRLHAEAGESLLDFGAELVIAIGGDARWLLEPLERAGVETYFFPDAASAEPVIEARVSPRDVVLVKASRGVRAERIVERLVKAHGRAR